ncbi:Mycobacterium rhizamassiliense ORFan [Mycobacterium rhizamassiliense]|jgi:hypothetical protein|uniref:Mycobacterium rhizamassiliense ORFan n=1 Tax=Mycobacterium rhizamassiliense TaxID=1841860 RepID=A0A2U3NL33_9MYCO|nr:Mycobacterium rhizamassiliense ORFan [Mycobacterium rhizamassiliense]
MGMAEDGMVFRPNDPREFSSVGGTNYGHRE